MRPPRAGTPASPVPDQDIERVLLLSLIRIHLSRVSTDALQALERELERAGMSGAATRSGAAGEALKRVW
jgi:hypothetical protein